MGGPSKTGQIVRRKAGETKARAVPRRVRVILRGEVLDATRGALVIAQRTTRSEEAGWWDRAAARSEIEKIPDGHVLIAISPAEARRAAMVIRAMRPHDEAVEHVLSLLQAVASGR